MFLSRSFVNIIYIVLITSIHCHQPEQDDIRLNSTSLKLLFNTKHGKLPLEAIEESTEETRRRTSTPSSSSIKTNDIDNSTAVINQPDSFPFSKDTNTSSDIDKVYSRRQDEFGGFRRAFCRTDLDCNNDGLVCFRDRCRPSLDCSRGQCGLVEKWDPPPVICVPGTRCHPNQCRVNSDCPNRQACIHGQCSSSDQTSTKEQIADNNTGNSKSTVAKDPDENLKPVDSPILTNLRGNTMPMNLEKPHPIQTVVRKQNNIGGAGGNGVLTVNVYIPSGLGGAGGKVILNPIGEIIRK